MVLTYFTFCMKRIFLILLLCFRCFFIPAQPVPFILKGALKENRQQLYRQIVNNSITKNLSLPFADSTEDQWQQAFYAMELISFRSAWADSKIRAVLNNGEKIDTLFQRDLLELVYTNYPGIFRNEVRSMLTGTNNAKIFSMCAVYLLKESQDQEEKIFISGELNKKLVADKDNPLLQQLQYQLNNDNPGIIFPSAAGILRNNFLPGNILMLSFQRRNRNYPGVVIIRDADGNFIKDDDGKIFFVPQLARSLSDLPAYLTNGNTPEGIFRMDGFDTSRSSFIGPTTNIQLTMPFEYNAAHFFRDSSLNENDWNIDRYKSLLPPELKNYYPLYQTYYAGKAGRTEIIAHGTTIDPAWYKNKPYFPLTPTQGCLCCKEIWNEENGRLVESDQQKLVNAIIKAGGPYGYAIVINIDDQQKPVAVQEVLDFLAAAQQK